MMTPRILTVALAGMWLGACSLAPTYERPAAPVPAAWQGAAKGDIAARDIAWRDYFTDARLAAVIDQALAGNRDLRATAASIERARALYRVQRAEQLPGLNANGAESAARTPAALSTTGQERVSRQYSANVGIAAWELDFFGRVQSLKDQALAQYLAAEESWRSSRLSLVSEVASAWLTLGADRERLSFAQETLRSQRESLQLVERRAELGSASALELAQARTTVESARLDVATYGAQVELDRNALELLVGGRVADDKLPASLPEKFAGVAALPAGLPADTLLARPDVRAAEQNLIAANANIGAARAAFFPRISLTATTGFASPALEDLFKGDSRAWSFAPQISLPIFNWGANQASLDAAKASSTAYVAQYEKAVQSAFREVADALAQRASIDERMAAQRGLNAASDDALRLSQARYEAGVAAYSTVLDAQRSQYAARQGLIGTRLAELSNRVTLYKVLGGGAAKDE